MKPLSAEARAAVVADTTIGGREFCAQLTGATDAWLSAVFDTALESCGVGAASAAICAVGGYGRGDLCPESDIDLLLVHDGSFDPEPLASAMFYPIWDSGLKLGHSVRTVGEALELAASDTDTATALLQLRHLRGSSELSAAVESGASSQWSDRGIEAWILLADAAEERHRGSDEVAFLLEPDLKAGRGGLRDIAVAAWADRAHCLLSADDAAALTVAETTLLEVRVALHLVTGRHSDVLTLEEQDEVAARLGIVDADVLMAEVAGAAREAAWIIGDAMARARSQAAAGGRRRFGRGRKAAQPQNVGSNLEIADGMVRLTDGADVAGDPFLGLDVALAAATASTRIARSTLDLLVNEGPPPPSVWSAADRERLVRLLSVGRPAIGAIEALEHHGLFSRLIPEWEPNRSRPQRNAYHRFTVDRHLLETAATAAELVGRVGRPDLLMLGALFHDIGKGFPGDHTEVGIELVEVMATRMGFGPDDVASLVAMVRHHLLLPDVATRRDLDDDGTIRRVADAVGSVGVLELLDALCEADSRSTGPSAWSRWKAGLVRTLVARVTHVIDGGSVAEATSESQFPNAAQMDALRGGEIVVRLEGDTLWVVSPDSAGVFCRVAGVIAINGLDVLGANAHSEGHMALSEWVIKPERSTGIDIDRIERDLRRGLSGHLAITARVAERTRTYGRPRALLPTERTEVVIDAALSDEATVIQVLAPDCPGVLYRITRAMVQVECDIRSAKVETLGPEVVDSFYVTANGEKITDEFHLGEIERALLHAVSEALGDAGTPRAI